MTTPNTYYALHARYEELRALAFRLVMSEAVSLDTPEAQAVFEKVGDMTEAEADDALREAKAMDAA